MRHFMREVYSHVDKVIAARRARARKELGRKESCRGSGCWFCCRDTVVVSPAEAEELARGFELLPEATRTQVLQQLERWWEVQKAAGTLVPPALADSPDEVDLVRKKHNEGVVASTRTSAREGLTCMFLVDQKCSVYEHRGFQCRGHHSFEAEGPEVCQEKSAGSREVLGLFLSDLQSQFWRVVGQKRPGPPRELHDAMRRMVT